MGIEKYRKWTETTLEFRGGLWEVYSSYIWTFTIFYISMDMYVNVIYKKNMILWIRINKIIWEFMHECK